MVKSVRLACLMCAASVYPEPGSNSLVNTFPLIQILLCQSSSNFLRYTMSIISKNLPWFSCIICLSKMSHLSFSNSFKLLFFNLFLIYFLVHFHFWKSPFGFFSKGSIVYFSMYFLFCSLVVNETYFSIPFSYCQYFFKKYFKYFFVRFLGKIKN